MRVLYAIFARGGSKSIPEKNLRKIGGLSLIGYKARSAKRAKSCSRLLISTDSPAILAEAERFGVETPFVRPGHLATDHASTDDVASHLISWVEEHESNQYDALMILEPSSPFATAAHYDEAVRLLESRAANVVLAMKAVEVSSCFIGPMERDGQIPSIVNKIEALAGLRRQDQEAEYTMNGGFYLVRWNYFKASGRRYGDAAHTYGVVMPRAYSIEIDEPLDLEWARFLVTSGHVDMRHWVA